MNVLWQKGSATVHQVLEALPEKPALAYNSVLTTIRILERKGYVKHAKDGRAHVYIPQVGQKDATRFEIRHLVSRFSRTLMSYWCSIFCKTTALDTEDLKRLRQLLEEKK